MTIMMFILKLILYIIIFILGLILGSILGLVVGITIVFFKESVNKYGIENFEAILDNKDPILNSEYKNFLSDIKEVAYRCKTYRGNK